MNHVKLKTAGELAGILQTVLFCPEDLALIKAGAAERRAFLDHAICQLRPRYGEALSQYHKLLEHKTRILRDWEKNPGLLSVLEDFNEAMARAGALVIHYRAHFIRKLAEKAGAIQEEFSGGPGDLGPHLQNRVHGGRSPGPHRLPLRGHPGTPGQPRQGGAGGPVLPLRPPQGRPAGGHQRPERPAVCLPGQTRTAALSLKLAEREIFREDTSQWPILLLDDVLSELDQRRQDFVLERITGGQVFITGCQAPERELGRGKSLHIVQGRLEEPPQ